MIEILSKTKSSQKILAKLNPKLKGEIINTMATSIKDNEKDILIANKKDIENAIKNNLHPVLIDRLKLDSSKIDAIVLSLQKIATLEEPVGKIIDGWTTDSGLNIKKISIAIGTICVIYESRPNVTAEVAGLCFKSGNACVLKGGKEAINSNLAIINAIHATLKNFCIKENVITFLENINKDNIKDLLVMDKFIDAIIPRGGNDLINFITSNSKIPVIKHDRGLCHIFVDWGADLIDAVKICVNAKCQKPSTCNSVETLLVHKKIANEFLSKLKPEFDKFNVTIYGCENTQKIINCFLADEKNYDTEYLDFIINIKIVENLDEAINHINKFSSGHSEAILSQNYNNIQEFYTQIDSACLYANASTRFSDGYEFGLGGEIGISTNKIHARGPMGLKELTTYKYIIDGNGQIRE